MLVNKWSLFDHEKSTDKNYEKCTKYIGSIKKIDEFWNLYLSYPKPSQLFYNGVSKPYYISNNGIERYISAISFFKDDILPEWEHSKNKYGGEIGIRDFPSENTLEYIDNIWETILIYCISNECKHINVINGIRLVDSSILYKKQYYRLELWFSDIKYKDEIEKEFIKILNIDPIKQPIFFKTHNS